MGNFIPNKILIIRLSSLGDVLLTTPVIRALKKKYPSSEIDFIVKQNYRDAVRLNPNVSETINYSDDECFFPKLKEKKYDFVVDLQNNFHSRRIVSVLKVPFVYFKKPTLKKFLLVHFKINLLKDYKQIPARYAESVNGLELDNEGLDLFLPEEIKADIPGNGKTIGICPGAKHFTKRWLPEYFIELGNALTASGYTIAILGGKDDSEICHTASASIKNSINLCNNDNLFKIAANMSKCKLIICNDSGLMHLAAAMKVPVAALFGSSVKEFGFTPYFPSNVSKNLILENNSVSCRPCSHVGKERCPKHHFKCMKDLTPAFVTEKILNFIA